MSDYIKREDAINLANNSILLSIDANDIARISAADVVRVVRCKDCKHRILHNHYAECDLDTGDPYQLGREADEDDWFCADGEKREE